MKQISAWKDLAAYGIDPLTAEACGLSYRILCDATEQGKRIIEQCFDVRVELSEPWNRGAVGSIMLAPELLTPLAIFALLESGCREVWRSGETIIGIEADDAEEGIERWIAGAFRRYAYAGTAGAAQPARHDGARAMKITLQRSPPGCYLIVAEDGCSILVQTDWEFPGLASTFGWCPCPCGFTDGTVDCEHRTTSEMIADASAFLDDQIGVSVDDPGYFAE